jgi:hypothetical protein
LVISHTFAAIHCSLAAFAQRYGFRVVAVGGTVEAMGRIVEDATASAITLFDIAPVVGYQATH